jgi:catechol 2,3-dioxygenase-like lactoylglutathione lyase family enzyme
MDQCSSPGRVSSLLPSVRCVYRSAFGRAWRGRFSGVTDVSPLGTIDLAATSYYVRDLDRAVAWYREKLGLSPVASGTDGHGYASFVMGSAIIVLEPLEAALEAAQPGLESSTVNLVVSRDPEEVRSDLLGRGVTCGPIVPSPNFVSFLIRDLDGNRFYVTRPVSEAAKQAVSGMSATG